VCKIDAFQSWDSQILQNVCVINAASDTNCGGGWRGKQKGTIEESLCNRSTLGLTLEHASSSYPIPLYGAIFVPHCLILIEQPDEGLTIKKHCSIITIALRQTDSQSFINEKIQGIFKIAIDQNVKNLVLPALGAGAFGNDIEKVIEGYKQAIKLFGFYFDNIIFSIIKHNFYTAFQASFSPNNN
jgi:uncharacterized protein (TIGR02452 family)